MAQWIRLQLGNQETWVLFLALLLTCYVSGERRAQIPEGEVSLTPLWPLSKLPILCSCSSPTDKKSNSFPTVPLKSHYSLRKRNSLRGKPSTPLKRTLPKELVQITKHRLCRLPVSKMHIPAKDGKSSPDIPGFDVVTVELYCMWGKQF